jgi:hypothetical protein
VLVPHSPGGTMLLLSTLAPAECHSEARTFLQGRGTFLPAACEAAERTYPVPWLWAGVAHLVSKSVRIVGKPQFADVSNMGKGTILLDGSCTTQLLICHTHIQLYHLGDRVVLSKHGYVLGSPLPNRTSKMSYVPACHAKSPAMLEVKMTTQLYRWTM